MPDARGVVWEYVDAHTRSAEECVDCGRWFVASEWHSEREGAYCPECWPLTALNRQVERSLAEADSRPTEIDVAEIMDGGNPR